MTNIEQERLDSTVFWWAHGLGGSFVESGFLDFIYDLILSAGCFDGACDVKDIDLRVANIVQE